LVGKVWVGSCSRRDSVVEGVTFTGNSCWAVAADCRQESRLAVRLFVLCGRSGFPLALIVGRAPTLRWWVAAGAVDPEEVLNLRRQVTWLVGVFARGQREAREIPALFVSRHGRRARREKLRHVGQVAEVENDSPLERRRSGSQGKVRGVKERAVGVMFRTGQDGDTRGAIWPSRLETRAIHPNERRVSIAQRGSWRPHLRAEQKRMGKDRLEGGEEKKESKVEMDAAPGETWLIWLHSRLGSLISLPFCNLFQPVLYSFVYLDSHIWRKDKN
jgi:hypothetical protein